MFSQELLWNLRTNLPMEIVLIDASNHLEIPYKRDGLYVRFICPNCSQMQATVHPKNNLAHCFSCNQNFNNIDLFISRGYQFTESANILLHIWNDWKLLQQKHMTNDKF